jgi:hypothetical protein
VIAAGMAKSADDRPATAGTLIADMLRALDRTLPAGLVATG